MQDIGFPLISLIVWLPALGALALLLVPREQVATQRTLAMTFALLTAALAVAMVALFDRSRPGFQLIDSVGWVPSWGIGYTVSVDGISLWLVLLNTLLVPVALAASWGSIERSERGYTALILLLATGLTGVFVAQDMLLFYIFFEFTLLPTALLIGVWGGAERRHAAMKFFLYTFGGSVFMLLGIIALYLLHGQATGVYTFDLQALVASLQLGALRLDPTTERLLFALFFIGFAVKVPLWPFHTWMTTAHAEAPNSGAVDLLGMLVKIGAYGLIRFNVQLFPAAAAWAAPAIATLAVIGILYAAWLAYQQTDLKRLLAYSSVSHLGFIVLGIFALNPQGISGAVLQMISSALTTGALFLIVGMLYARYGTRDLRRLGGLWHNAPVLGTLALVMVLGAIGLPGLNGFIGEYLVLQGAWLSPWLGWAFALPATLGVVLAAAYLLHMFRATFMGEVPAERSAPADIRPRELLPLAVLLVPVVAIGLYPNLVIGPMQPAVTQLAEGMSQLLALR